jgi:hypothetical protein
MVGLHGLSMILDGLLTLGQHRWLQTWPGTNLVVSKDIKELPDTTLEIEGASKEMSGPKKEKQNKMNLNNEQSSPEKIFGESLKDSNAS